MRQSTAFIDAFRGVAAFWVLAAHCFIWTGAVLWPAFEPKKAVDLFMVISGFLMMLTYRDWRSFYLRRYFRIAPAYYVALAAVVLLWPVIASGAAQLQSQVPAVAQPHLRPEAQDFGAVSLFAHLTFLFGLSPSLSSSTMLPDWSLSLEMQFYAAFPLIHWACRKWSVGLVCVALAVGAMLFTREYQAAVEAARVAAFDEPSLLPFKLPVFLVGVLIYEAGKTRAAWLLALAASIFVASCRWYGPAAAPLAAIIAAFTALWWQGGDLPAFRSAPVRFLSNCSYSVYLFHIIAVLSLGPVAVHLFGAGTLEAALALLAVVGAVTYGIAAAAYRWIELPGIALGRHASGRRHHPPLPIT